MCIEHFIQMWWKKIELVKRALVTCWINGHLKAENTLGYITDFSNDDSALFFLLYCLASAAIGENTMKQQFQHLENRPFRVRLPCIQWPFSFSHFHLFMLQFNFWALFTFTHTRTCTRTYTINAYALSFPIMMRYVECAKKLICYRRFFPNSSPKSSNFGMAIQLLLIEMISIRMIKRTKQQSFDTHLHNTHVLPSEIAVSTHFATIYFLCFV